MQISFFGATMFAFVVSGATCVACEHHEEPARCEPTLSEIAIAAEPMSGDAGVPRPPPVGGNDGSGSGVGSGQPIPTGPNRQPNNPKTPGVPTIPAPAPGTPSPTGPTAPTSPTSPTGPSAPSPH